MNIEELQNTMNQYYEFMAYSVSPENQMKFETITLPGGRIVYKKDADGNRIPRNNNEQKNNPINETSKGKNYSEAYGKKIEGKNQKTETDKYDKYRRWIQEHENKKSDPIDKENSDAYKKWVKDGSDPKTKPKFKKGTAPWNQYY